MVALRPQGLGKCTNLWSLLDHQVLAKVLWSNTSQKSILTGLVSACLPRLVDRAREKSTALTIISWAWMNSRPWSREMNSLSIVMCIRTNTELLRLRSLRFRQQTRYLYSISTSRAHWSLKKYSLTPTSWLCCQRASNNSRFSWANAVLRLQRKLR